MRFSALLALIVVRVVGAQAPARGVVPPSVSRPWVEMMRSLKMPHEYIEVPGGDHGTVISSHQAEIFAFFAKHTR